MQLEQHSDTPIAKNASSLGPVPLSQVQPPSPQIQADHQTAIADLASRYACSPRIFQRLVALSLEITGRCPVPLLLPDELMKKELLVKFTSTNEVTLEKLTLEQITFQGEVYYISGPRCQSLFFGKGNITGGTKEFKYSGVGGIWFDTEFYPQSYAALRSSVLVFDKHAEIRKHWIPPVAFDNQGIRCYISPTPSIYFWSLCIIGKLFSALMFHGTFVRYQFPSEQSNNPPSSTFTFTDLNGILRLFSSINFNVHKRETNIVIEGKIEVSMEEFYGIFKIPPEKLDLLRRAIIKIPKHDPEYVTKIINLLFKPNLTAPNMASENSDYPVQDLSHGAELASESLLTMKKRKTDEKDVDI